MPGVYGYVSPTMRDELNAALQARWEGLLRQRALSAASSGPLLNRLLTDVRPAGNFARLSLAHKTGHR
jgi:hypothetical protein